MIWIFAFICYFASLCNLGSIIAHSTKDNPDISDGLMVWFCFFMYLAFSLLFVVLIRNA